MNKTICIGTKNLGRLGRVYCKISIENGKLSISGVEGPLASGNALGGCGQIQDHLQPIQKFEPGWNDDLLAKFVDVWNAWHLNDRNAGCRHQVGDDWDLDRMLQTVTVDTELWRVQAGEGKYFMEKAIKWVSDALRRKEKIRDAQVESKVRHKSRAWYRPKFPAMPEHTTPIFRLYVNIMAAAYNHEIYEAKSDWERSWYGEGKVVSVSVKQERAGSTRLTEHPGGLLCKPCPECGYKYGTKWLKEELPADVIKFLKSLPDSEYQPAWV